MSRALCSRWLRAILLCVLTLSVLDISLGDDEVDDIQAQFGTPDFQAKYPPMSLTERQYLKAKAKEMFYHAYDAYMTTAFPHDEIMPRTCQPRIRGVTPGRGHVDEVLGHYMLTLIDALDTLIVMEEYDDFMIAVKNICEHLTIGGQGDFIVNVFEVNIRIVAGLISGHVFADIIEDKGYSNVPEFKYEGQLLAYATEVANRLLPAFDTPTGIPYTLIPLSTGFNHTDPESINGDNLSTCPATAGTFILEFGALSRLTGNPIYERKARDALLALWHFRNKDHDLWGSQINVKTGKWGRKESQIGAGVDSYLEYLLKAYMLFGNREYLDMFESYYDSIESYMESGGFYYAVNSENPVHAVHVYVDTFTAFWPGVQVMKGDIQKAIRSFHPFYIASLKYKFVPEAFTSSFVLHWPYFNLRPEFVESAYFLFKATGNEFYRHVVKEFMENLEKYCKVKCGYTALKHLGTMEKGDGMDSFFLAETMKYIFLIFAEGDKETKNGLFNFDDFVLTTEAHFLPLPLRNKTPHIDKQSTENDKYPYVPSTLHDKRLRERNADAIPFKMECKRFEPQLEKYMNCVMFPNKCKPSQNGILYGLPSCSKTSYLQVPLNKERLDFNDPITRELLKDFGIQTKLGKNGQYEVSLVTDLAASETQLAEGWRFIIAMINEQQVEANTLLSQAGNVGIDISSKLEILLLSNPTLDQSDTDVMDDNMERRNDDFKSGDAVDSEDHVSTPFSALGSRAAFGDPIGTTQHPYVEGCPVLPEPLNACHSLKNAEYLQHGIAIVSRGGCTFAQKARMLQSVGSKAMIVFDNTFSGTLFTMSHDGSGISDSDISIPSVFISRSSGEALMNEIEKVCLRVVQNEKFRGSDHDDPLMSNKAAGGVIAKSFDQSDLHTTSTVAGPKEESIGERSTPHAETRAHVPKSESPSNDVRRPEVQFKADDHHLAKNDDIAELPDRGSLSGRAGRVDHDHEQLHVPPHNLLIKRHVSACLRRTSKGKCAAISIKISPEKDRRAS
eukprot:Nk52_evm8s39 gene=Nk52_evmTU8s39